jgi:peptidoglycan/xylan/chitin deacetylase (PgdA/CDA1 family)
VERLLKFFFPSLTWRIPTKDHVIYLTFDDGPIPEITPWVLEQLKLYNAKATFFCIGDNVRKHPDVMKAVIDAGHSIGNHTMHHLNGFLTLNKNYFKDIEACREFVTSKLFRPPYGKIRLSQIKKLKNNFRIIMWDVLSKDYDISLTGAQCFQRVKNNSGPGSIIVFHDSLKAENRLRFVLPATLKYFSEKGYTFQKIS